MAIVLSNQENIELLLFLLKLTLLTGVTTVFLLLLIWFRLKNLEKRIHLSKRHLKSRFNQRIPQKTKKLPVASPLYRPTLSPTSLKKISKRADNFRWRWLFVIAIAIITGIAIALMQLGNSFISPEFMPFVWLFIGVTLFMSATFVKIV